MPASRQGLQRISDLLTIPESEMTACLAALRTWSQKQRTKIADARRQGLDTAAIVNEPFVWSPRDRDAPSAVKKFEPHTDVGELGLRPSAVFQLRELNIFTLEDFTEASADELTCLKNVGHGTVSQVRDYLRAIGLDFKESANPWIRARDRARVARAIPADVRKTRLDDSSPLEDTGLALRIIERCMKKDIRTLGDLRAQSLRDLFSLFGAASLLEIMETLDAIDKPLTSAPSQLERWRYGAVRKEDLQRPSDDAPVQELQPWLGAEVKHLARAGYKTVGDVHRLVLAGGADIRYVGPHGWERIATYFSAPALGKRRRERT